MADMKQSRTKGETLLSEREEPEYPYGLSISLDKDGMAKLGITALPEVGAKFSVAAKTFVRSTSAYDDDGDGKSMNLELQITEMELSPGDSKDAAETLFEGE